MINTIINTVIESVRAVCKDRRGLESLEYAVFAGGLLVLVVAAIAGILGDIQLTYANIGAYIATQAAAL